MDPGTAALGAGGAAVGGALSIASASARNSALAASARSVREAARVQYSQIGQQANVERLKNIAAARRAEARVRVVAADQGGVTGSYAALDNQAAFDAAINDWIIKANAANNIRAARSGAAASLTELAAREESTLLAGLGGGLRGLQSGLQIGSLLPRSGVGANTGTVGPAVPGIENYPVPSLDPYGR